MPRGDLTPPAHDRAGGCDCPGHGEGGDGPDDAAGARRRPVSRRTLLQTGGLVAGLSAGAGILTTVFGDDAATRYAFGAGLDASTASTTRDVLVVISLRGGFDGLSAVVPAHAPQYYDLRPDIAVPASKLVHLDRRFGLHPAMKSLAPFWHDKHLAIVQAVGQTDPTRSHFAAMAEMERAAPGSSLRTGWLDRALGLRGTGTAFRAVQMGSALASPAFGGPAPELTMPSIKDFTLSGTWDTASLKAMHTVLTDLHAGAPASVGRPASAALKAVTTTTRLSAKTYRPAHGAKYPTSDLGRALKDVARLVKAKVGLQVAAVDVGDWDMHVDLGSYRKGWMHDKLKDLADSLAAFAHDLGPAGLGRVTVVTMSEFGRRVAQNGSGGVDHGHGNAMFVLGGGVKGGKVYGRWPGLAAAHLDAGDLAATTDYRVVLREILVDRCLQTRVGDVFPGLHGRGVGLVRPR